VAQGIGCRACSRLLTLVGPVWTFWEACSRGACHFRPQSVSYWRLTRYNHISGAQSYGGGKTVSFCLAKSRVTTRPRHHATVHALRLLLLYLRGLPGRHSAPPRSRTETIQFYLKVGKAGLPPSASICLSLCVVPLSSSFTSLSRPSQRTVSRDCGLGTSLGLIDR